MLFRSWTVVGGQPLYRLPTAYVDTGFGTAYVCEGSTTQAPTYPDGVYTPDPYIESAGTISGAAEVTQVLTFTPGSITGTAPITAQYNWIRYNPGGTSLIVGTGLNYTVQAADAGFALVVQTVASNSVATVATQTVPYGPCTAPAPIIQNVGTVSVQGANVVCPNPGQVLEYGGATIFCTQTYSTYITWVNANDPNEVWQVGGDTFVIPPTAVGNEVCVHVAAFSAGGTANDTTNAITICGEIITVSPSKISDRDPLYVGDGLTGQPAVFTSYGPVDITYEFVDVTDPMNPIVVGYEDALNYNVTSEDYGKSFAFRTIGTIGILTATSLSPVVGPAEGYLNVATKPKISYTGDIAYPGTVLTGTAGTFSGVPPVTSVTSRFYRNDGTDTTPNWVAISPAGATTFTVSDDEVGKDVAYGSKAINPLFPSGVLSFSDPVRPKHYFTYTSQGTLRNVTRPGSAFKVGDVIDYVFPHSSPENDEYGGTVHLTSDLKAGNYEAGSVPFTIPANWYGLDAYALFSATYEGVEYPQTSPTFKIGGTKPSITAPGTLTSNRTPPFTPEIGRAHV